MTNDRNRLVDGYLSYEAGVDSGFAPNLIGVNQLAWAVNTTVRGGFPTPRPGWRKITCTLPSGLFQGAGQYIADPIEGAPTGLPYIAVSISGLIHRISISENYAVTNISIPSDPNQADLPHAWFQQAENWLIVQNGANLPYLYNGASAIRSDPETQVPVGGPMAYGKGRLWVARDNLYYGGDLVYSDPALGRNSVIYYTENTFLNEGGAFAVPGGNITGLAFAANLDSSLGDGDLMVFTTSNVFAFSAPIDRDVWKDLQYPIQRFALLNFGALNHESIAVVNGDLLFRSQDGIRSLMVARRDFTDWGQSPISRQVVRALKYDTLNRLGAASAVNFDNRFLLTIQPQQDQAHGTYHRGLVALDYDLVSGMGVKLPPAWEGVWTGLNILRILTVRVENVDRCYIFALSETNEIELWEVTRGDRFDQDGTDDVRIKWAIETRSTTFAKPFDAKRLEAMDQWYDQLTGQLDVTARFRPNLSECWTPWATYSDCAQYRSCDPVTPGDCQIPAYFRSQSRARMAFTRPPDVVDSQTGRFTRIGYEFQMRLELEGYARLQRLQFVTNAEQDDMYGDASKTECITVAGGDCSTGSCGAVTCCDPDDFTYKI